MALGHDELDMTVFLTNSSTACRRSFAVKWELGAARS
jgi:hypothetical protein